MLVSEIDCTQYSTSGSWSYVVYDNTTVKCYDTNPDRSIYNYSGNLLLRDSKQIYIASKVNVFDCHVACIGCHGLLVSDCIECASRTRG